MLTLDKFEEASEKVKEVTLETKLVYSDYWSQQTGNKVYLKPENMQFTGAYKVRGAYYKISTLSDEERAKGLITASAGNHAQGVAYAAKCYGCKAVIVMPTTTPLIKVNRTKSYGAEVVLYGDVYDEACQKAYELADKEGYTFIHPFDDLAVATGQGTIAMEIFKELPLVEYILVPIGGGGLATGVSTLAKLLNPKIKVIGVEPAGANCMQASFAAGKVTTLPQVNTIADGTAVKTPGSKIFPYIQKNLDDIITVEDDELVVAFLDMVENHKMIVETTSSPLFRRSPKLPAPAGTALWWLLSRNPTLKSAAKRERPHWRPSSIPSGGWNPSGSPLPPTKALRWCAAVCSLTARTQKPVTGSAPSSASCTRPTPAIFRRRSKRWNTATG